MKIVWYTICHHASGQGSSRCVASLSSTILFALIEAPSKPHLVIDTQWLCVKIFTLAEPIYKEGNGWLVMIPL